MTDLVVITTSLSLPRDRHLNLLFQDRLELGDEADMSQPFLHHHRHRLCPSLPAFIHGILQHVDGDAVPSEAFALGANFLFQRKVAM